MTRPQTDNLIDQIVKRITDRFETQQIVLFGSYARGLTTPDSDADLLIVMNVNGSKRKQAVEIDLALSGIPIPTDIIVVTPADIEKYRDTPGTIIAEALREGKLVYDHAA